MQIGTISFCDKVGYNIKANDVKKQILEDLETQFNIKILSKHYELYDDNTTIQKLTKNPHMMSLRTNGNIYYMILFRYGETNMTLMVDKKIQQGYFLPRIIIVRTGFDESLFTNYTIFEGEMVKCINNNWSFIIADIITLKGKLFKDVNMMKRINIIYDILGKQYKECPIDVFKIKVKKYFNYSDIQDMMNIKDTLPYTTRGILFKPMFQKFRDILLNFDATLIEKINSCKNPNTSSIDFNMNSTHGGKKVTTTDTNPTIYEDKYFDVKKTNKPDIYELYENDRFVDIACVPTMKASMLLRNAFISNKTMEHKKLLFRYNNRFTHKWVPVQSNQ